MKPETISLEDLKPGKEPKWKKESKKPDTGALRDILKKTLDKKEPEH